MGDRILQNSPTRHEQKGLAHTPSRVQGTTPFTTLQSALGNRALETLLNARFLQPKLSLNRPGDAYEVEADTVAESVLRIPDASPEKSGRTQATTPASISGAVQRCSCGGLTNPAGECEECSKRKDQVMRTEEEPAAEERTVDDESVRNIAKIICPDCEEDLVQAKEAAGSLSPLTADVEPQIYSALNGGRPLPDGVRAYFEPRFGYDFGNVRIHTETAAAKTARSINALAYTVGPHIVFAADQFQPGSHEGRRLLAHELTHVIQQNSARRAEPAPSSDGKDGQGHSPASLAPATAPVSISKQAAPDGVFRHTKEYCDEMYERCSDGCRRLPNRTRRQKARRALCWSACMAEYAACLASSEEALVFAAIVAAIVLASADGPFPIGDAAAALLLISLGITGSE